jgi:hypothetical protein
MNKATAVIIAFLFALPCFGKEWKSRDGSKSFEGQLVSYSPPWVVVIHSNGKRMSFKDDTLSDDDKEYCHLANRVLTASYPNIPYRVIQVMEHGVLGVELAANNPYNSNELFFIWGDYSDTAAENDTYRNNIYWAGSYSYTTVGGVDKTVRSFTPSLDEAVHIWRLRLNPPKEEQPKDKNYPKFTKESMLSSGTGFAISDAGHIVTNAHVIEGASVIRVCIGEQKHEAEILAQDKANDLVILKISQKTIPMALKSAKPPGLGDNVIVAGFPNPDIQGRSIKITKGGICGMKGIQDDIRHFQIDAAVQPGNSGGPLLNEESRVIGIVNAKLNDAAVALATGSIPQNVNYAIKLDYLISLINSVEGLTETLKKTRVPPQRSLGDMLQESTFIVEAEIKQ